MVTEYMQAKSEAQTLAREVAEWQRKLGVAEQAAATASAYAKTATAGGM